MGRYKADKTEYMFKIVYERWAYKGERQLGGPYAQSFSYGVHNKWQKPIKGKLINCQKGYHVLRLHDINRWMSSKSPKNGHKLFLVKADMRGHIDARYDSKVVVRNFMFVCELDVSKSIVGGYLYGGPGAWMLDRPTGDKMNQIAAEWGIDVYEDGEVYGKYEKLSIKET